MRSRVLPLLLAAACGPNLALVSHEESALPGMPAYRGLEVAPVGAVAAPKPIVSAALPFFVTNGWAAAPRVPDLPTPPHEEPIVEPPSGPRGIDVSVHLALGLPDGSGVGQLTHWLLVRPQFVSSYDTNRKTPNWSAWKLEATDFGPATRATTFKTDPTLPGGTPQARDDDYRLSGFDRGHLCPSADRTFTDADNDATFFLTNVVPQTHASNAGPWLDLEDESRQLANQGKQLIIIAGPIFSANPPTIGTGVQVPASMFKVAAVLEGGVVTKVYAAIIPNAAVLSGSWRQWQVTARTVEQQTGLDFLSDLSRESQDVLENRVDP